MPYGLPTGAIEKIVNVFRRDARIHHVWLYGSRAKGTERIGSDIDLCIESPKLTLSDLGNCEMEIDDLLLPWKVDLTLLHAIDSPKLVAEIKTHAIDLLAHSETKCLSSSR